MHSTSSCCPLPSTPAMPRISPLRIERLTLFSLATPSSNALRFRTDSISSPGFAGSFRVWFTASRPIISFEMSPSFIPAVS